MIIFSKAPLAAVYHRVIKDRLFKNASGDSFEKYTFLLACCSAFLLPLKLSLCYLCLIPLIILWTARNYHRFPGLFAEFHPVCMPLFFLLAARALSSPFGLNIWRSLRAIPSMFFFPLAILVYADIGRAKKAPWLLFCLLFGQGVAALHSLFEGALSGNIPRIFLGQVSESGQIGMTLVAAAGLLILCRLGGAAKEQGSVAQAAAAQIRPEPHLKEEGFSKTGRSSAVWAVLNLVVFSAAGFAPDVPAFQDYRWLLLGAAVLSIFAGLAFALAGGRRQPNKQIHLERRLYLLLLTVIVPLIAAALLINLKRGPWVGVSLGASLLLWVYARRLLIPLLTVILAALIFLEPIQNRLAQSSSDFFITGGRSVIWEIGLELSLRYPLGIGLRNSSVLRDFSLEIPREMTHFHNNLINILVEGGWISLVLYLWWIFSVLRLALTAPASHPYHPLIFAIGAAILSWQAAGLVEYNFGDSEVLIVAYMLLGLLLGLLTSPQRSQSTR